MGQFTAAHRVLSAEPPATCSSMQKLVAPVVHFDRELIRLCDDVTVPEWRGYVTGAALCTSLLLQALLFHLTFHLTMTLGLRVKAALTAAIFKKVCAKIRLT